MNYKIYYNFFLKNRNFLFKLFLAYLFTKLLFYIKRRFPKNIASFLLSIPLLNRKIKSEIKKSTLSLEEGFLNNYNNFLELPEKSFNEEELNGTINSMTPFKGEIEQISGVVYHGGKEHIDKLIKIYHKFSLSNPLHPDLFPEVKNMEIDLINMVSSLFKGGKDCCGNVTYGGTESLLLTCVTYRDYYKDKYGISNPNIVAPLSIHPAVDKACHYFGIKLIKVPLYKNTGTSRICDIRKYINSNTILLIGSAPSYPHGIIDPISEMGELAYNKGISFHIDCCMGGFLVPFVEKYNYINFNLKGVTSISMDTHKYGYSLKGSSILLFKSHEHKKYQHFINNYWNGGIYASPTMMGSKSGGLIAVTWASLLYFGKSNFIEYANIIRNNLNYIKNEFANNDLINIIGEPDLNIIAFSSQKLNIYNIISEMKDKNWKLSILQNPDAFHMCITKLHTKEICEKFCTDLKDSIEIVKNNKSGELKGTLAIYGSSKGLDKSIFMNEVINDFIFLLSRKKISDRYDI